MIFFELCNLFYNNNSNYLIKEKENIKLPECVICLEKIKPENSKTICENKHCYHKKCIRKWLKKERTCPICRNHIPVEPCSIFENLCDMCYCF